MIIDLIDVLEERREPLLFLPAGSFGYLYYINGLEVFLMAALVTLAFPVELIKADREFRKPSETSVGRIFSYFTGGFWILGYPFGIFYLWWYMDHRDIFLVGLLIMNVLTLMLLFIPINWFYEEATK